MSYNNYREIQETGLFEINFVKILHLKGTDFIYDWYVKQWRRNFDGIKLSEPISFNYVFENSPEAIQCELLYHINLFR
jgi:hypothetical protein